MKAYLIDPFEKTVTETTYSGDWKEISKLIKADFFDVVDFSRQHDTIYVDDEGLLKNVSNQKFFYANTINGIIPLAGYGLVIGCDDRTGKSRDVQVELAWVKSHVAFVKFF